MNILLLENEAYTRRFVRKIILESVSDSEVHDVSTSREAIERSSKKSLDIAVLDIELGEEDRLNGLETAKIINAMHPKIKFIFISGYSEYAIEAFSVHSYDYILKPINVIRFKETICSLEAMIREEKNKLDHPQKIVVKNKNEIFFIPASDILFMEKQEKTTLIHTEKDVFHSPETLTELEVKLGRNFMRVHKSFIVNKDKISRIKDIGNRSYEIKFLETNKVAFMSRYKFEELKNCLIPSL